MSTTTQTLANMILMIFFTDAVGQGVYLATDMKLTHIKTPPRTTFIAGVAVIMPLRWAILTVSARWVSRMALYIICPNGRTVYSSSVIWGLIGPQRLYPAGNIYSPLLQSFWIGLAAPFITYFVYRWTKKCFWDLHVPLQSIFFPLLFFSFHESKLIHTCNYHQPLQLGFGQPNFNHFIRARWIPVSR
ncbi:Tetrapeptide transporter OPT1/isp4 [Penicillium taxi]|uniref:Tetrapeptide transporter OPT1/isp4 n=1 Tax=Penicillium taxi TaxID=168475 RepID=UPI0025452339|nr:Tetrapeptide transporter OPT1/isp4 [Penicillium taxi]KAJ5893663.1 Tetrapeptide transporter OPT1/isp4 [Penicillium taxi]